MAATDEMAARAATAKFGLVDFKEIETLLAQPSLNLIYIATPPFLHHRQAMQALAAGMNVLVEKPMAMLPQEVNELIAMAEARGLLVATNLLQRYNPLAAAVKELLERRPLGALVHAYFENYACDEQLAAEHWFWDRQKSGGIFVEHGVHFFDLFAYWLGPGTVEAAQVCRRPGAQIEDQVQCTVRYGDDVLVNFYHGFTQTGRMDRQELRLVFERGDVRLDEWVPVRATLRALVTESELRTLRELFPGAQVDIAHDYEGSDRHCGGRHRHFEAHQMIDLRFGYDHHKMTRYGELVRDLLTDQLTWVGDRTHVRRLTERDGREAVAMAVAADDLAHRAKSKT
jgi:predicted dehydrogenase